MTRTDYELIAAAVRESGTPLTSRQKVAEKLAEKLTTTNPLFDARRFIAACTRRTP